MIKKPVFGEFFQVCFNAGFHKSGLSVVKKVLNQPFILAFGAIVNIPLNIILIKKIGMMGAAFATLLTYIIVAACTWFFAQRHYRIAYEYSRIAKIGLSFAAAYGISALISIGFPASIMWLSNFLLFIAFFVILYITGFFKKSEIAFIAKTFSTMRGGA